MGIPAWDFRAERSGILTDYLSGLTESFTVAGGKALQ
jgi:hypothetical protein